MKSLKNSTIISCQLRKLRWKAFIIVWKKRKGWKIKGAETQVIPHGVRNIWVWSVAWALPACSSLLAGAVGIGGHFKGVREIVVTFLLALWFLAVHRCVAMLLALSYLVPRCQWFTPDVWTWVPQKSVAQGRGRSMAATYCLVREGLIASKPPLYNLFLRLTQRRTFPSSHTHLL